MNVTTAVEGKKNGLLDFMGQVEERLASILADEPLREPGTKDTLMSAARHLCMGAGGKRARPALVRLFGEAVGASPASLLKVAVAAELIHSASLLHDDVVDSGMFRRSRPTVNAQWGNIVAVLTGDIVLSLALGQLVHLEPRVIASAVATVTEMTRAAIAEVESRGDLTLSLEQLRGISEGKTGALFGWCGQAAALLSDDAEAVRRFHTFGRRMGVAFQIADDIRDITGADEGKPQYADVQSRTLSAPILIAVAQDESLRRRLNEAWAYSALTPERVKELGLAIFRSGAIEESQEWMSTEIVAGIDALGPYSGTPSGAELIRWSEKLLASIKASTRA